MAPTPAALSCGVTRPSSPSPRRLGARVVLLSGLLALGCRARAGHGAPPDGGEADAAQGRKAAEAILTSSVLTPQHADALVDVAFDRLLAAPQVDAAGERLFEKLAGAPELQTHFQTFVAEIPGNAGFQAALVQVMAEDPTAPPETVATTVASRMERAIDGPDFDAALDLGIDRLFDRSEVDAAIEMLVQAMLEPAQLEQRFATMILDWQDDLEAAVGVPLAAPQFEAAFVDYLEEGDRAQQLEVVISERIAGDPRIVEALAALIDSDAMRNSLVERTETILADPGFRGQAIELLAMLATGPEPAALHERTQALLVRADVVDALVGWLEDLARAPQTQALGEVIGEVLGDPSTTAELATVLLGPPRGQSA